MYNKGYRPDGELCRGLRIYNNPAEEDLTALIASACSGSLEAARDLWGLPPPRNCHIFVVTSWLDISFRAVPWYLRPFLVILDAVLGTAAAADMAKGRRHHDGNELWATGNDRGQTTALAACQRYCRGQAFIRPREGYAGQAAPPGVP